MLDVMPIGEARARLTELAEEVVGAGSEEVLTKDGASFVAIVDARTSQWAPVKCWNRLVLYMLQFVGLA